MSCKIDLIGQRFGRLLIVEEVGRSNQDNILWKCLCDCGNEKTVNSNNLRSGNTKSCGCLQKERVSEANKDKIFSKEHRKKISKARIGKHHSEETKKRMSKIKIGKYHSEKTKKRMSEIKTGKVHSGETKKKISKANKGKYRSEETRKKISEATSGKNNPNYNPNLTDEERQNNREYPEYKEWRKLIYKKDNYTCQYCGDNRNNNLVAHHLDGYDNFLELRTEISNGVTMCVSCHDDFHNKYGRGNNTKEQYEEFIENNKGEIMEEIILENGKCRFYIEDSMLKCNRCGIKYVFPSSRVLISLFWECYNLKKKGEQYDSFEKESKI